MRTLLSLVFVVRLLCEIFDVRGVKFEVPSVTGISESMPTFKKSNDLI